MFFIFRRNCPQDVPPRVRQAIVRIHVGGASDPAVVQITTQQQLPGPINPYSIEISKIYLRGQPLWRLSAPFTPHGIRRKGPQEVPPRERQARARIHAGGASEPAAEQSTTQQQLPG